VLCVENVYSSLCVSAGYEPNEFSMGGVIGRYAGRIKGGQFSLDRQAYQLFLNSGPHSIHGGKFGFVEVGHSAFCVCR
jgi:aldose 1-epimerase